MAGINVTTDAGGRAEVTGIGLSAMPLSARVSGPLQAAGDATSVLQVDIFAGIGLQLTSSTAWSGTIVVLASMDGGATWPITVPMLPWVGGASLSAFAANGNWECSAGQITHLKAVALTAISGGPVTATLVGTFHSKSGRVGAPAANPVPVITPLAAPVVGQVKIVTTGTPVQLPAGTLVNGLVVKASVFNQAQSKTTNPPYTGAVGGASTLTTAYDASVNSGYPLAPGEAGSFACANANLIYVNGTAGDVFSFEGS